MKYYFFTLLSIFFYSSTSAQAPFKHPRTVLNDSIYNIKPPLTTQLTIPLIFISAGVLSMHSHSIISSAEIAEERNENIPNFRVHVDDYLQYAPILAAYGFDLISHQGKNDLLNKSLILLKSELMVAAIVLPSKNITHRLRPDGSSYNSFPSGHTAQAFAAATFLHKELGHKSIWYSIGGYAAASSVGALRILNNRHYLSDVLAGAGVGILATNLAYYTHSYRWGHKRMNNTKKPLTIAPTYQNNTLGIYLQLKL